MRTVTISVIIPVYECENYLSRCIDSVLSQTFTDFELILVDDGSLDNSGRICDEYAQKDSRIRVIHNCNEGVGAARNTGLEISCGQYICFIDSDDWIDKDLLSTLMEYSSYDYVMCAYITEPNGTICFGFDIEFIAGTLKDFLSAKYYFHGVPWGKLFRNSIIKTNNIRFKQIKVYEDILFCCDYVNYCNSIRILPKPLYHYFEPIEKIVCQKYPLKEKDVLAIYKYIDERINIFAEKNDCDAIKVSNKFLLHLPLKDYLKSGNIDALFRFYKSLNPSATIYDYYEDLECSPIYYFFEKCRKECFYLNIKDSISDAKILNKYYGDMLGKIHYPYFSYNIWSITIKNRLFFMFYLYKAINTLKEEMKMICRNKR